MLYNMTTCSWGSQFGELLHVIDTIQLWGIMSLWAVFKLHVTWLTYVLREPFSVNQLMQRWKVCVCIHFDSFIWKLDFQGNWFPALHTQKQVKKGVRVAFNNAWVNVYIKMTITHYYSYNFRLDYVGLTLLSTSMEILLWLLPKYN